MVVMIVVIVGSGGGVVGIYRLGWTHRTIAAATATAAANRTLVRLFAILFEQLVKRLAAAFDGPSQVNRMLLEKFLKF